MKFQNTGWGWWEMEVVEDKKKKKKPKYTHTHTKPKHQNKKPDCAKLEGSLKTRGWSNLVTGVSMATMCSLFPLPTSLVLLRYLSAEEKVDWLLKVGHVLEHSGKSCGGLREEAGQGPDGIEAKNHRTKWKTVATELRDEEQPRNPGSAVQDSEPGSVLAIWLRDSDSQSHRIPRNHIIASPRTVGSKTCHS